MSSIADDRPPIGDPRLRRGHATAQISAGTAPVVDWRMSNGGVVQHASRRSSPCCGVQPFSRLSVMIAIRRSQKVMVYKWRSSRSATPLGRGRRQSETQCPWVLLGCCREGRTD